MIQPDRQPTRLAPGEIDPVQPIDPTHPLTRGLEGLWLPLPRLSGGGRLYDLSGWGRHGDLTNMDPADDWITEPEVPTPALNFSNDSNAFADTGIQPANVPIRTVAVYYKLGSRRESRHGCWDSSDDRCYIGMWDANNTMIWGAGTDFMPSQASIPAEGTIITLVGTVDDDGGEARLYLDGKLDNTSTAPSVPSVTENFYWGARRDDTGKTTLTDGSLYAGLISSQPWHKSQAALFDREARRGFPDLLRRRDESALYVSSASAITGTASITDGGEIISAAGQTEVSGTLSVTDSSETLTINGATKVSGTASITDAAEQITASGSVITTGSLSVTDSGELISMVSTLEGITGTVQITDSGEEIGATGEVKIAGTATLTDGTEEIIVVGKNDITGSLSFADLAEEIAATGAVEVQGSLALTDSGEEISARERVPARLASVNVRLEDILVVHATFEDALTVDAKLTD